MTNINSLKFWKHFAAEIFLFCGNGVVVLSGDITLLKAKTIKHLWFLIGT